MDRLPDDPILCDSVRATSVTATIVTISMFCVGTMGQVTTEDPILYDNTRSPFELSDDAVYGPADKKDMRALTDVAVNRQSDGPSDIKPAEDDVSSSKPPFLQCNVMSHSGCDVNAFERCLEPGYCGCLKGYVRTTDTGQCVGKFSVMVKSGFGSCVWLLSLIHISEPTRPW